VLAGVWVPVFEVFLMKKVKNESIIPFWDFYVTALISSKYMTERVL